MTWNEWYASTEKKIRDLDLLGKTDVILRLVELRRYDEAQDMLHDIKFWVDQNSVEPTRWWDHVYDDVETAEEAIDYFRRNRTD